LFTDLYGFGEKVIEICFWKDFVFLTLRVDSLEGGSILVIGGILGKGLEIQVDKERSGKMWAIQGYL